MVLQSESVDEYASALKARIGVRWLFSFILANDDVFGKNTLQTYLGLMVLVVSNTSGLRSPGMGYCKLYKAKWT